MTDEQINDESECPEVYPEALTETRRVIDMQVKMIENTDSTIVSLIQLNLLGLGGLVTLAAYLPDLIAQSLPWVVLASIWSTSSILIGAFIYRGATIYAGFGDHGHDDNIPRQKLPYNTLISSSETVTGAEGTVKSNIPSPDEYRSMLLNEHQSGISHNNVEIKFRSQIQQQVILLLLIAIITLGIGLSIGLTGLAGPYALVLPGAAMLGIIAAGMYIIVKSLGLIGRFIQTKTDPNRLSYGYAFEREYPNLSKLCQFVLEHLYDPNTDGNW